MSIEFEKISKKEMKINSVTDTKKIELFSIGLHQRVMTVSTPDHGILWLTKEECLIKLKNYINAKTIDNEEYLQLLIYFNSNNISTNFLSLDYITLPTIRKVFPTLITNELISVPPMPYKK